MPLPRLSLDSGGSPTGQPAAEPGDIAPEDQPTRWRRGMARGKSLGRRALPFGGGVAAMLAALVIYNQLAPAPRPLTQQDVQGAIGDALASMTPAPALSVQAYRAVAASVVLVQTARPGGTNAVDRTGSGVVVSMQGHILTSLHVVDGAPAIQLTFADGSRADAAVVAAQPEDDIAVLQARSVPAGVPPATIGNPAAVRVGDEAFVVGSPFGLYQSLTAGVISGLDREFTLPETQTKLTGLIQIDAAVNPGSSGGPLVNRSGDVIGIVAALVNPTRDDVFVGVGLAVPIDVAGGAAGLPPY